MKRFVLINTREGEDKETKDKLLFLTIARLPSKMSNGNLWYPKKDELLSTICINKSRKPDDFKKYSEILPGTLIDVTFGINDFNGKAIIAAFETVEGTENIYDKDILYV